jgi:hypothetical protein
MYKEIKTQWCEALLSGRYKKIKGFLRNNSGYDALGVLTDLYIKNNPGKEWVNKEILDGVQTEQTHYWLGDSVYQKVLAPEVMEWAGLPKDDDGTVLFKQYDSSIRDFNSITACNDTSDNSSFKSVVEIIEEYL